MLSLDGKNFAMLETTSEEATRKLLCVVKMSDFNKRTFLLRRVVAVPISPKNNLGNMEFAIAYNSQSLAEEIFDKKHLIKDSFHNYMPYLKIFLPDEAKVRRTKTLEPPPKPTVVYVPLLSRLTFTHRLARLTLFRTFAAKVLGVTHEVKSLRDSNGAYTHDVVLTKVHITVNDEDLEIAAWAHTGMFLAHVLNDYIYQTVGFAFIEASSWVGKTITKINLSFGVESKLKLPDVKSVVPQIKHSAMKNTPKFLMEIGSFEGKALCSLFTVFLASLV
jgi:hypothetical protein